MSDSRSWTEFTISLRDWTCRTRQAENPIFAVWPRHVTDRLSTKIRNRLQHARSPSGREVYIPSRKRHSRHHRIGCDWFCRRTKQFSIMRVRLLRCRSLPFRRPSHSTAMCLPTHAGTTSDGQDHQLRDEYANQTPINIDTSNHAV